MRHLVAVLACGLGLLNASPLSAQDLYAGFAAGRQFRGPAHDHVLGGELGLRFDGRIGVRLEGFETIAIFFVGPSVTYALRGDEAPLEPYLFAGGGVGLEIFEDGRGWLQGGGGVEWRPESHFGLYAEGAAVLVSDAQELLIARIGVRLHPLGRR